MATRTTIQIDDALAVRLRKIVPPRRFNRFVNEAIEAKVNEIERQRIEREMKEGYLATRGERNEVAEDWAVVDAELWPS